MVYQILAKEDPLVLGPQNYFMHSTNTYWVHCVPCCHLETHLRHISWVCGKKRKRKRTGRLRLRALRSCVVKSPHTVCEKPKSSETPRVKELRGNVLELELPASDFQAEEGATASRLHVGFVWRGTQRISLSLLLLNILLFFHNLLVNVIFSLVLISALVLNHKRNTGDFQPRVI